MTDTPPEDSDPEEVDAHLEGKAATGAGDYLDADPLANPTHDAGRLPMSERAFEDAVIADAAAGQHDEDEKLDWLQVPVPVPGPEVESTGE
jgi:hypothetical protein